MAGSIYYEKDRGRWVVSWRSGNATPIKIRSYNQHFMPCTHFGPDGQPDKRRCQGYKTAVKLLALVQARWEQYQQGKCDFRIEEFTGSDWSDVIEFYKQWMKDVVRPNRKPSTIHCYESYLANWIEPFFAANPCRLHEIRHDTLQQLLSSISLAPKGKLNVMMTLRSMLGYAWRCERIPKVPPFPKREQYGIVRSTPDWLTIEERNRVMERIPEADRAIFHWLNLHYRRPGEACALHKTDFDQINRAFWIRRALSKRQVVNATKTHKEHYIPCAEEFLATARRLANAQDGSPYLFINPRSRKHQGRYTLESLRIIWYAACDAAAVRRIWVYRGTKHTSCTAFIEEGGTIDELQMLTDHARRDSLKHYADITLHRKRMLMERNRKRLTG